MDTQLHNQRILDSITRQHEATIKWLKEHPKCSKPHRCPGSGCYYTVNEEVCMEKS